MITSSRGYTIFEVMVVLAVTSVIFFSAVTLFSGRQNKTQFSQAMADLQSKIQSYATEVSSGSFPNTTNYHCQVHNYGGVSGSVRNNRPELLSGAQDQSTSQDCVYIGKAIQVAYYPGQHSGPNQSNQLYIYNVFGLRQVYTSNCSTLSSDIASNFLSSCPTVAADYTSSPGNYILMDTYTPLNGVRILSARYGLTNAEADVLQLYSSFDGTSASSQNLTAYTVQQDFSHYAPGSGTTVETPFRDCMELQTNIAALAGHGANCGAPATVGNYGWILCVQDTSSNQYAKLTVDGASTGITTKLQVVNSCS